MISIPYSGPKFVRGDYPYAERCAKAELPAGYRFLKKGETIKDSDLVVAWGRGPWENEHRCTGENISDRHYPYIRKVSSSGAKRDSKGRFVSAKPAPTTEEKPFAIIYAEGTGDARKYRVEHGGAPLELCDAEFFSRLRDYKDLRQELIELRAWKEKVLAATI